MTHHTDAERAEFEAWARDFGTWEVKRDDGVALGTTGYTDITLTVAWHAVQAARRAPAAPVPQGWKLVPEWPTVQMSVAGDDVYREDGPDVFSSNTIYTRMLAAAPQPPEAAPVQLPDPVAKIEGGSLKWHIPDAGYSLPLRYLQGTQMLYTEQQVRELLAAQASVSNGTLASQPPFQTEAGAVRQLEEIAVLAWLLVRALRKADPANPRAARALDYLKRHGLQGNPLRAPGD